MQNKLPIPVCTVFLACRQFATDGQTGDDVLIGLPRAYWGRSFPSAAQLSFFIRCTSAHGDYPVEVQLQNVEGEIVWKEGPTDLLQMPNPLEMYDLKMTVLVVFPKPRANASL